MKIQSLLIIISSWCGWSLGLKTWQLYGLLCSQGFEVEEGVLTFLIALKSFFGRYPGTILQCSHILDSFSVCFLKLRGPSYCSKWNVILQLWKVCSRHSLCSSLGIGHGATIQVQVRAQRFVGVFPLSTMFLETQADAVASTFTIPKDLSCQMLKLGAQLHIHNCLEEFGIPGTLTWPPFPSSWIWASDQNHHLRIGVSIAHHYHITDFFYPADLSPDAHVMQHTLHYAHWQPCTQIFLPTPWVTVHTRFGVAE